MRRALLLLASMLICAPPTVFADQHPNIARGFDIGKPYQMNGIDNVNLFNGNLTITLPIGQRYHVNGNLGYGLTLVYSGNIWDSVGLEQLTCGGTQTTVQRVYPNRRSNAGLGWLLSLGRLFPPNAYPVEESLTWQYETPDGGLHALTNLFGGAATNNSYSYTNDGTYLRMKTDGANQVIEFPDGTSQVFKEFQHQAGVAGQWTAQQGTGIWRLSEIKDRFGNSVSVTYSSDAASGSNPSYPEAWTISDAARTQHVYFKQSPSSVYDVVLDRIVLATFGGASSEWKVGYTPTTVTRGSQDHDCAGIQTTIPNAPLLTSLTLPAVAGTSQVYSMMTRGTPSLPNYYVSETGDRALLNGQLLGMQLPTKGWLEWDYVVHTFPVDGRASHSIAVSTRRMVQIAADGTNHTDTWTYQRTKSVNNVCVDQTGPEQLVVAVTTPENVTNVHYFSTYTGIADDCSTFKPWEYSLPFSRGVVDPGNSNRFLSSETFTTPPSLATSNTNYRVTAAAGTRVRSEWVTIARDDPTASAVDSNQRESSHATYFDDDAACAGSATCYSSVNRYLFDGGGHYRQSSTGGNFPGENFKTTFINHVDLTATGDWLFSRPSEKCTVTESVERPALASGATCSSLTSGPGGGSNLSGPFIQKFCFDANGFLTRRRDLATTSPQKRDVIAVFAPSTTGNLASEKDYGGGDDNSADSADLCSLTLPASDYEIVYDYIYGARKSARYTASGTRATDPGFNLEDNTIDANTGMATASKDSAQLQTTYTYDALGRVTQVVPPGEATITYTFTEAGATPAKVVAKKTSASANTGANDIEKTIQSTTIFDDFGRPVTEQRLMPDGTAERKTEYTGSGWVSKSYDWGATQHFTSFANFDPFGRARTITAPDGKVTTLAFDGSRKVTRTVEVQTVGGATPATTTEVYDRFGRLYQLTEPGGTVTTYGYDAADRLSSVSMGVQSRSFTYDGRGFLTSELHPENGYTYYKGYDARGHVGRKEIGTNASPFDLAYVYDAAERLSKVTHPASRATDAPSTVIKAFDFATANGAGDYSQGKLKTATRYNAIGASTIAVKETYVYGDAAGRLTNKVTEITGAQGLLQKFNQPYAYNDLGLPSTISYPTCAEPTRPCAASSSMLSSLTPTYENGLLKTVPSFANTVVYSLNGMVTEIDHHDGISDLISVDSAEIARPSQIQFNSYDDCTPPAITQQPASQQVQSGASLTLTVAINTPTAPFQMQWFRDGVEISGATGLSYQTTMTQTATFTFRVTNSCGKADSNPAVITVCGAPNISAHPQNATIGSGSTATLSVTASGCATLHYQWYQGSAPSGTVVGTDQSTFTTLSLTSQTSYWVRVTDGAGGTINSNTATITVCSAPSITAQPQNQSVNSGSTATLSVSATGCGQLSYQWYAGVAPNTGTPVGSNASTYQTPPLSASSTYWVRVTNVGAGNSVDSNTATITVNGQLPTPGAITATRNQYGSVDLSWGPSPGAEYYEITRKSDGNTYTLFAVGTTTLDQGAGGTTRVYRVRARSGSASSDFTAPDIASVRTFPTVLIGGAILYTDVEDLRATVNDVRAVRADLPNHGPLSWTDLLGSSVTPPAQGGPILAVHIRSLRAAMDTALRDAGMPTPAYTDDLLTPTVIKAVHIRELQQRAQ